MIRAILLSAILAACGTGEIRRSIVGGETLVEHIDTSDHPATCPRAHNTGCFQIRFVNGRVEKHIWKSAVAPAYVKIHEDAHRLGLQHTVAKKHNLYSMAMTPYQQSQQRNAVLCSTIVFGVPGYPLGHLLCNDGRSEWTIAP